VCFGKPMTRRAGEKNAHERRPSATKPLVLGNYPTAVERIDALSNRRTELWAKRDDLTHEVLGGNKVRKLEWLLAEARAMGSTRIVTAGAAGSHHVLATTYFGIREGFEVEAVLAPQPRTDHVVDVLRADIALGLRCIPAGSWTGTALSMGLRVATAERGTRAIAVGGSSVTGAMGYVGAARELAAQIRAGQMPEPDVCVVALGSGGTAAGLAAGFEAEGLKTRVVGVCVSQPPWALRLASLWLGHRCAARAGASASFAAIRARLAVDSRFLGTGYGHPTSEGDAATAAARAVGLALDSTYTAKAFASALWHVRARRGRVILYWHTLSSAPMQPLLASAPREEELGPRLRGLLSAEIGQR
jgi:1-aminocyclopropane-1-carboxylate deaminase/D-cysteine desulfhydrase-like pyridoxal-dependent ACC family enzyme